MTVALGTPAQSRFQAILLRRYGPQRVTMSLPACAVEKLTNESKETWTNERTENEGECPAVYARFSFITSGHYACTLRPTYSTFALANERDTYR